MFSLIRGNVICLRLVFGFDFGEQICHPINSFPTKSWAKFDICEIHLATSEKWFLENSLLENTRLENTSLENTSLENTENTLLDFFVGKYAFGKMHPFCLPAVISKQCKTWSGFTLMKSAAIVALSNKHFLFIVESCLIVGCYCCSKVTRSFHTWEHRCDSCAKEKYLSSFCAVWPTIFLFFRLLREQFLTASGLSSPQLVSLSCANSSHSLEKIGGADWTSLELKIIESLRSLISVLDALPFWLLVGLWNYCWLGYTPWDHFHFCSTLVLKYILDLRLRLVMWSYLHPSRFMLDPIGMTNLLGTYLVNWHWVVFSVVW